MLSCVPKRTSSRSLIKPSFEYCALRNCQYGSDSTSREASSKALVPIERTVEMVEPMVNGSAFSGSCFCCAKVFVNEATNSASAKAAPSHLRGKGESMVCFLFIQSVQSAGRDFQLTARRNHS